MSVLCGHNASDPAHCPLIPRPTMNTAMTHRAADWAVLPVPLSGLAECPFWHPHEERLYWVDIAGRRLLRCAADGSALQTWDMPAEPGCMAPVRGGGLVVALRHGVFRATAWGGELQRLTTLPYDAATVRANDGKCDALGRFWVGTVDETRSHAAAELFCIDARSGRAVVTRVAGGATTGNGLAWSLDQRTLYWADTPAHVVHAWPFDAEGPVLGARRVHLQFDAKPAGWSPGQSGYGGRPDGAVVDSAGHYWVAMYEGARLCRFAPDGSLQEVLSTPVQCPTMPCLGGPDLRTLFVTSARHGRSEAELQRFPHSGGVFSTRVEQPGQPVALFAA